MKSRKVCYAMDPRECCPIWRRSNKSDHVNPSFALCVITPQFMLTDMANQLGLSALDYTLLPITVIQLDYFGQPSW